MPSLVPKYRPSFTAEEIIELHSYLINIPDEYKSSPLIHSKLLTKIATLTFKLSVGIASPSFISTPRQDVLESLGGSSLAAEPIIDPAVRRLSLYKRYMAKDDTLTGEEILDALEYKEYALKETLTSEEQAIIDDSWHT